MKINSRTLKLDEKVTAEYLVFEKEILKHKNLEYESFAILSEEGQVIREEKTFNVKPGDLVTVQPKTVYWITPKEGQTLTGLLWYHY